MRQTLKEAMGQMTTADKLAEAYRLLNEAAQELVETHPDHEDAIVDAAERARDALDELQMGADMDADTA